MTLLLQTVTVTSNASCVSYLTQNDPSAPRADLIFSRFQELGGQLRQSFTNLQPTDTALCMQEPQTFLRSIEEDAMTVL